jgi:deoxyribodipyrimidine photo-lyase
VPSLLLFTRDLRLDDHPALTAASRGGEVVPLFVLDRTLTRRSANRTRFLLESLADLDRELGRRSGRLFVREGDPAQEALRLAREAGCDAIHVTADESAVARTREATLERGCRALGLGFHRYPGNAAVEPGEVAPAGKEAYTVFTPYHRAWSQAPRRAVLPAPDAIRVPVDLAPGPRPDITSAVPDSPQLPPGGATAGRVRLASWVARGVEGYADARDDLAGDRTSRLSPYLRFGCISANEVVARAPSGAFTRQLAWRDFYRQLLAHEPSFAWKDLRAAPSDVPPQPPDAPALLEAWRDGRTGIPLVDAGMRQLLAEGWMHNRARMVVASFLTRRLGIPWQEGAAHFMRLLVDGDPANNSGGWQWAAGTGTDPRRSRSFNPVLQAKRHDPDGRYIRRWVPELAATEPPLIFAPWKRSALLRSMGYPEPLLEVPANGSGPGDPPFQAGPPAHPGQTHPGSLF